MNVVGVFAGNKSRRRADGRKATAIAHLTPYCAVFGLAWIWQEKYKD